MALNDSVTLGNSGLRVSRFCLGGMTFGEDWGWGSSAAESDAIMARFLSAASDAERYWRRRASARSFRATTSIWNAFAGRR